MAATWNGRRQRLHASLQAPGLTAANAACLASDRPRPRRRHGCARCALPALLFLSTEALLIGSLKCSVARSLLLRCSAQQQKLRVGPELPLPREIHSASGAWPLALSISLSLMGSKLPRSQVEVTKVQTLEGETPESGSKLPSFSKRLCAHSALNIFIPTASASV